MRRWIEAWQRWRQRAWTQRRAREELDRLFFERPEVLASGRLKRHHRARATILEIDVGSESEVTRILFGIIRHPKAHPLASRGEEVLELLEYLPIEGRLSVAGSRNLTRRGRF